MRGTGIRSARWGYSPGSRRNQRKAWTGWSRLESMSLPITCLQRGWIWWEHNFQMQSISKSGDQLINLKIFGLLTEKRELIGKDGVQANREVHDATIYYWCNNTCWQLCDNFSKEVGTNWVHVIIDLSEENWSLVWEDQNNVLNRVESNSHSHEEESTITVLHTLNGSITVLEQDNCENSCDYGDNKFHIRCLR